MTYTIERQVFELITERLKQHLVNNYYIGRDDNMSIEDSSRLSISGNYNGSYSREFVLEITAEGVLDVSETTLFADLGSSAPAPIHIEINFEDGVSFDISTIGLSGIIAEGASVGDAWLLRCGIASHSILQVVSHPSELYDLASHSLAIYSAGNERKDIILETEESTSNIAMYLTLAKEYVENNEHFEIIGDIRDCINRDPKLWDNTKCLASDLKYLSDIYYEQTDRGNSIFEISIQVTYRNQLKDSRAIV